jgi:ribosomal-protein-alanine N-acetyltransferase
MTITLSISLATTHDAVAIADLSRGSIEQGMPWRYKPAKAARMINDRDFNVIVARDPRSTLAGFGAMRYDDETAHLYLLAVDAAFRGQGVGREMLAWLEKSALTAGIGTVLLECRETNQSALAFYRSVGYRELSRIKGYYLGREDALRLGKDLFA